MEFDNLHQILRSLYEQMMPLCEDIRARGGKVTREAGPMQHGSSILAFVEDPDGYKIELLSPSRRD